MLIQLSLTIVKHQLSTTIASNHELIIIIYQSTIAIFVAIIILIVIIAAINYELAIRKLVIKLTIITTIDIQLIVNSCQ